MWIYVVVAAAIALAAFGVGQIVPGLGIWVAIVASMVWTAWSANRASQTGPRG
jgi:hypothetical protein